MQPQCANLCADFLINSQAGEDINTKSLHDIIKVYDETIADWVTNFWDSVPSLCAFVQSKFRYFVILGQQLQDDVGEKTGKLSKRWTSFLSLISTHEASLVALDKYTGTYEKTTQMFHVILDATPKLTSLAHFQSLMLNVDK